MSEPREFSASSSMAGTMNVYAMDDGSLYFEIIDGRTASFPMNAADAIALGELLAPLVENKPFEVGAVLQLKNGFLRDQYWVITGESTWVYYQPGLAPQVVHGKVPAAEMFPRSEYIEV